MAKGELSGSERAELIIATREAAHALVDDLQHIREIIEKPLPTTGDVRRMSAQLRRIVVEHDLRTVAGPRVGRINLLAPDLRPLHRHTEKSPVEFISGGRIDIMGMRMDGMCFGPGPQPAYDPSIEISLTIDQFRDQRVIYARKRWVTRGDVIQYVANVAHGVHTSEPRKPQYELLGFIRHAVSANMTKMPEISFNRNAAMGPDEPFVPDRTRLDLALMQLVSTAGYLVRSPQVLELEQVIKNIG